MARMYPSTGPVANQSRYAEPLLYHALATQLPEEFVVIHSLPWLAQVAKSVDGRSVPTGEVDFLVLHPSLGILAEETDALQEIITPDPLATLCAIIRQLHAEGVSSPDLLVIYTGKNPPKYPKEELPFIPTTYSVYRSRGLEAPVVIVWNSHEIEESALLCAYSRATSRCIAIYNAAFLETVEALTETDTVKSKFRSFLSSEKAFSVEHTQCFS